MFSDYFLSFFNRENIKIQVYYLEQGNVNIEHEYDNLNVNVKPFP